MRILTLIIGSFIFISCNDQKPHQKNDPPLADEAKVSSAFDLEPQFASIDSMQVLYFDDPYGDSLRYTRFFRFVNTGDSILLNEIKSHLQHPYEVKASTDTCRSEGKIYLLAKGEPVKTIYFSTRCPGCCYTYFIKDGNFYYFDLNESLRERLSGLKKSAKHE